MVRSRRSSPITTTFVRAGQVDPRPRKGRTQGRGAPKRSARSAADGQHRGFEGGRPGAGVARQLPGQAPGGDGQRGHHRLQLVEVADRELDRGDDLTAGSDTGIATPQIPGSNSQRVTATLVNLVTARARRKRSGEVTVCWV